MKTKSLLSLSALAGIASLADEAPHTGNYVPGRVTEANSDLFTNAYFSEELTGFVAGAADDTDLDAAVEFYSPTVPVNQRFEYLVLNRDDDFESELNDERAVGEDFKRVKSTGEVVQAKTVNRGLMMTVDRDEVGNDPNWQQRKIAQLIKRMKRNRLRRAINLLSAAAVNTNRTWDATAGKDPDQDLIDTLITAADSSGITPNRVGFGHTAWAKRGRSHRAQDSAGGFASAAMLPDQVAGLLGVDDVHVSKSRYNNGSAKSEIIGNKVLSFYAESGVGTEDPSNIKGFVSMIDGLAHRVYVQELGPKLVNLIVEAYELTAITSTLGIRQETIS